MIEAWTPLEEDQDRLRNKSGANRLGFALLLKSFEVEVRFPEAADSDDRHAPHDRPGHCAPLTPLRTSGRLGLPIPAKATLRLRV
ncbi:hypothetical protein [Streptomyces atratus]|uniref:hypothetical protein n=1 Tax=Streptomyces atratus TaxID=1893 RepID=UPI003401E928